MNHYSEDDARSLAVVTTFIHQPTNEHLKPAKGETFELGFDYENKGFNFRITGFRKNLHNGLYSGQEIKAFEKVIWEAIDKGPGVRPTLRATNNSIYLATTLSFYSNSLETKTDGLEFSCQFPKIKATNTSFNLSGSYLKTFSERTSENIKSSVSLTGSTGENRYGVYEYPAYDNYLFRSNLMTIQHIPEIRMLVTLAWEMNWLSKYELSKVPSPYPIAYYTREGEYTRIPEAQRSSSEFEDLYYSPNFQKREPTPVYFNFHLQLRKETKQGHSFSFYANNFLWYNPVHINNIDKQKVHKNGRISFGIGMNFKL